MKVRILGCGPSNGVPSLARGFGECNPFNQKNIRTRSSVLISTNDDKNILIDTDPEIRLQLLAADTPKIDAIFYTHTHYDHVGGANDIVSSLIGKIDKIPVYLTERDMFFLKKQLSYILDTDKSPFDFHVIEPYKSFMIESTKVTPILQYHGVHTSIGYKINNFAYSTDVANMDEPGFNILSNIDTWVLGVVSSRKNPDNQNKKHICLQEALEWIKKINPRMTYITHMGQRMDYETLCQQLPENVIPCYDGLTFEV